MPQLRDFSLLAARIAIGLVFLVRGFSTVDDLVSAGQGESGLALPPAVLWITALVGIASGLCFALGVVLPVAGASLAVVSLVSLLPASLGSDYYSTAVPATYVVVIALSCMAIGLNGGTFTAQRALAGLRSGDGPLARMRRW